MTDLLARLHAAGITGPDAEISLRILDQRLTNPTFEARALMDSLGVLGDTTVELVRSLRRALATLTPTQRSEVLLLICGVDAVRAGAILTAPMAAPDVTVLHLQPTDVLLIGNVGEDPAVDASFFSVLAEAVGQVEVFAFAQDIDVRVLRESTCPYCQTPDSGCPVHTDGDG